MKVLNYLGQKPTKSEVALFIWVRYHDFQTFQNLVLKLVTITIRLLSQGFLIVDLQEVDDDLDGYVSKEEFLTMYKRCISDETGLEPRKLFNLVQFLMYDKKFKGRVTVEETLQILYVRYGRERLDDEIRAIFG